MSSLIVSAYPRCILALLLQICSTLQKIRLIINGHNTEWVCVIYEILKGKLKLNKKET